MDSTAQRVAQIKERLRAATPGPWRDKGRYMGDERIVGPEIGEGRRKREQAVVSLDDNGGCGDPECCGSPSYHVEISDADAAFIAASRDDLEWLLAAYETAVADSRRMDWLDDGMNRHFQITRSLKQNKDHWKVQEWFIGNERTTKKIASGEGWTLRQGIDAALAATPAPLPSPDTHTNE